MKKVLFILGTRPEAIKMAPLIMFFNEKKTFQIKVCITSQHKELLQQVLKIFNIKVDFDLALMQENQTLSSFGSLAISSISKYIEDEKPEWIFVHGDTSTAFYASLAAFYNKVKIAHVEAGLRTWNKYSPFPEEINRSFISKIADLHFSPTQKSKENLLKENIDSNKIFVTGNTVIDSTVQINDKINQSIIRPSEVVVNLTKKPYILITMHRRENFGDGVRNICLSILNLAQIYSNYNFIYPIHPNPNVKNVVFEMLENKKNIILINPLDYVDFIFLMSKSLIILTDSGGIQEEAPSLGKPVLVLRDTTERPEAIEAGTVKLVGSNSQLIEEEFIKLMSDKEYYEKMTKVKNPYGNGKASESIYNFFIKNQDA